MKFKKLVLTIGSISAVAAPIAAVVSCGTSDASKYSESDLLKMSNLKSSEAHSKLQDLWLAKVLKNVYQMDGPKTSNLDILTSLANTNSTKNPDGFKTDFKNTLIWVLKNKLFTSKDALSQIYQSLKSNAPDSLINDPKLTTAISALNKKIFDRTEINKAVDAVFADDAWESLFYNYKIEDVTNDKKDENGNVVKGSDGKAIKVKEKETTFNPSILGIKDLVMKMMITKSYLGISSKEFGKVLPEEKVKLASKYKDSTLVNENESFFPLIVSVMNSRLAYKTSIELDASKSKEFIISNIDNNLDANQAKNVFKYVDTKPAPTDNSIFSDKLTYTMKHQTRVDKILAKVPAYNIDADKTVGFQGLSSLPTGDDQLDTNTVASIKLVKDDANARDGFIVDNKIVTKDIRYTDKDKTKVEVSYYTSLMPVYDTGIKSLEFLQRDSSKTDGSSIPMSDDNLDILMNEVYTKDTSLYSTAIKYFTADIKDGDTIIHEPILLNVTNDWARNYYIDEGLTYIDSKNEDEK